MTPLREMLFEAEAGPLKRIPTLPEAIDAASTAAWIKRALAGETPVPLPLVNQLATCLFALRLYRRHEPGQGDRCGRNRQSGRRLMPGARR